MMDIALKATKRKYTKRKYINEQASDVENKEPSQESSNVKSKKFDPKHIDYLERVFKSGLIDPSPEEMHHIINETGQTVERIRSWFIRRRTKQKKALGHSPTREFPKVNPKEMKVEDIASLVKTSCALTTMQHIQEQLGPNLNAICDQSFERSVTLSPEGVISLADFETKKLSVNQKNQLLLKMRAMIYSLEARLTYSILSQSIMQAESIHNQTVASRLDEQNRQLHLHLITQQNIVRDLKEEQTVLKQQLQSYWKILQQKMEMSDSSQIYRNYGLEVENWEQWKSILKKAPLVEKEPEVDSSFNKTLDMFSSTNESTPTHHLKSDAPSFLLENQTMTDDHFLHTFNEASFSPPSFVTPYPLTPYESEHHLSITSLFKQVISSDELDKC